MATDKPPSKASENRRSNKPIMEKRRRARINNCLNDLKTLILEAMKKDPARHSKLEKADILEMTVKYLQNLQRQQVALAVAADPTVLGKYRAGFNECASEVSRYISRLDTVDPAIRSRLLNHLSACLSSLAPVGYGSHPPGAASTPSSASSIPVVSPVHIQIPGHPNLPSVNLVPPVSDVVGGIQLVPSRLPSGEIAFLLPSQALTSAAAQVIFSPATSTTSAPTTPNRTSPPISKPQISMDCEAPLALTVNSSTKRSFVSMARGPLSPTSSNTSTLSPVGSDFSDSSSSTPAPSPANHLAISNGHGNHSLGAEEKHCAVAAQDLLDDRMCWRPW